MANNGYRLVHTTKVMYEFEPCKNGEYQYVVEFVGDKSYKESIIYRQFLEELGYKTFTKNIIMNFSIGKVKWIPWAKGMGQIATSSGTFDKEILIVEKQNDGKIFNLHTSAVDIAEYYKPLRKHILLHHFYLYLHLLYIIIHMVY